MSEEKDPQSCECAEIFNRLSKADRLKLRGAAVSKTLSGFIREDTETKPWRYPFYATYLLIVATPLPVPGVSYLTLAATMAWVRYSKSSYAARINGKLQEAFNHAALVRDNKDYISPNEKKPDSYRVKNAALAWHTTKRSYEDTRDASISAWKAFKNFVFR